jgi:predicted dehydrogenase
MNDDRRNFLRNSVLLTALSTGRIKGANDRIRVAGLGTGGRCSYLLGLAGKAGAEIVALCDVYEPRRLEAKEKLAPAARADYLDYREVLERKDLDAVIIGSPDHWHVTMTLDAIHAGKDVYVEKPVSHSIEEGERLEKAVAGSPQLIQVGYQQRSWPHFQAGRDVVASGKLGKITLVLASWYQDYLNLLNKVTTIDEQKLDWKRFLGSAPEQPFDPLRFTRWRWFWDFGGGHLTDLYSHLCDVIHWYSGQDSPQMAQTIGGRNALPAFQCPDTINAAYEYRGFDVVYNGTLVGSLEGGNIIFRGSNAMLKINRDGFAVYPERVVPFEKTQYPEPEMTMRSQGDGTVEHMKNFLDCVRSRKAPNADVKSAAAAARAAHLGNLAYRKGGPVKPDSAA